MNKYRYLLANTLLFALSGIIVKILSFFMLPLYTGVLTTTEYGIAELMHTTIMLLTPVLSLSVAEAVIRFLLVKDCDKKAVFTASMVIIAAGTVVLALTKPLVEKLSPEIGEYFVYFLLLYFATTVENALFRFAKGLEKVKACSLNGVIIVLVTIFTNLLLLLKFNMGLEGYLIAMIAAQAVSSIYLAVVCRVWKYCSMRGMKKTVTMEMLAYSIPFIPTAIAWWINSAFDRYMLVFILGTAANGLFGVASKIPAIINTVTSVFIQAWQISGIKEYGDEEYEQFFANIYNLYNILMVLMVAVLIPITPVLAKFLFAGEFYEAWTYVPVLCISSIFSGLTGVVASVFYAVKKTKILMHSTISGAVVNIVLNYILIKKMGINGAGIATMVSFAVVFFVRYTEARKYIRLKINLIRDIVSYILLVTEAVIMVMQPKWMYIAAAAVAIVVVAINIGTLYRLASGKIRAIFGR